MVVQKSSSLAKVQAGYVYSPRNNLENFNESGPFLLNTFRVVIWVADACMCRMHGSVTFWEDMRPHKKTLFTECIMCHSPNDNADLWLVPTITVTCCLCVYRISEWDFWKILVKCLSTLSEHQSVWFFFRLENHIWISGSFRWEERKKSWCAKSSSCLYLRE